MSDIPQITPKQQGLSEELISRVEQVKDALGAFTKKTSFIGEGLNDVKEAFKEGPATSGGPMGAGGEDSETEITGLNHEKVQARRNSLKQYGGAMGAAAIYLGDIMKKGAGEEEEGGGMLGDAFARAGGMGIAGMAGKLFPALMKAAPWAALAGGIIWGVIDAISGMAKAGEWDTDKASAAIGGFLGGTGSGFKNAFKNMGKWALIGAGVGSIVPVIGTIAGGLAGAAIGALLGFVGGEKIAQWVQKAKDALMDNELVQGVIDAVVGIWDTIVGAWKDFIADLIDIWGSDETFGTKLGESITAWMDNFFGMFSDLFGDLWVWMKGFFLDFFVGQKDKEGKRTKASILRQLVNYTKELGMGLINMVGDLFSALFGGIDDLTGGRLSSSVNWIDDNIIGPVGDFFSNIGSKAVAAWETAKGWVEKYITTPVGDFFSGLKENITKGWETAKGWIDKYLVSPLESFFGAIGKVFEVFQEKILQGGFITDIFTGDGESSFGGGITGSLGLNESTPTKDGNDLILTPQGDVVKTNPKDFIYAARDLSSMTDQESSTAIEEIQRYQLQTQQEQLNKIDQLIAAIQAQQGGEGGGNVIQTNITSNYAPHNIMGKLSAVGEL